MLMQVFAVRCSMCRGNNFNANWSPMAIYVEWLGSRQPQCPKVAMDSTSRIQGQP